MTTRLRGRLSPNSVTIRILAGLTILFVVIYGAAAGSSMWATRQAELRALREPQTPPLGTLVPERTGTGDPDEDPAFTALRAGLAARTWARLQMSCDFPEAADALDPTECAWLDPPSSAYVTNRFREIGPPAFEPLHVAIRENGTADVTTCALTAPSFYDTVTKKPLERDDATPQITTWNLAPVEEELAEDLDSEQRIPRDYRLRTGWGNPPAGFRTGESCQPQQPLTVQVFENWQATPAFTYFDPPTHDGASAAGAITDYTLPAINGATQGDRLSAANWETTRWLAKHGGDLLFEHRDERLGAFTPHPTVPANSGDVDSALDRLAGSVGEQMLGGAAEMFRMGQGAVNAASVYRSTDANL